ncbi:MAG TPA: 16S rRNA (guanine(966)-N(2))-methyltransferase RsmD [Alphaproteobacteria bacterium]|nr:16S rRNA (guanine(966)-N(2))-methyltransferase RsmD [Alphaproteobacteria bacterium]HNS43747.1 16S rRNA (guanine(966)-N(2))-methyltransferase RsmD [Alphaproteobacteria bacterium]
MRIIGGTCRGRPLKTPKGSDIRPTSDKVRLAIFNALYSRAAVQDAIVIDAFCGTGALGLESLSQGASRCLFCDSARTSLALAKENATLLGLNENASFKQINATKIGPRPANQDKATLVFLDPPYRKNLIAHPIIALQNGDWVTNETLFVIETEKEWSPEILSGEILFDKLYGDTRVIFWQS